MTKEPVREEEYKGYVIRVYRIFTHVWDGNARIPGDDSSTLVTIGKRSVEAAVQRLKQLVDSELQTNCIANLKAQNAALTAETARLNDYLTARVERCHEMQNKMDMAGNVIDDLTAELESLRQITDDTYNGLWGLLYPDSPTSWEYPGQIVGHIRAELEKVRAELEKCQQDAFNSGRDVQYRIDGRESAGFAELEY